MHPWSALLARAASHAEVYLDQVKTRRVGPLATSDELRAELGGPLPPHGEDPAAVLDRLAAAGQRGTVASQGPRYFGFVTGGSLPVAAAADWLVAAWDQNGGIHVLSPMVSVVEDTAARWLRGLAGLGDEWSVGFVTGCQMANFTALAAARHRLLASAGWDVESRGLFGAPPIAVFASDESHYTIFNALQLLGLGADRVERIATDGQGRMRADALAAAMKGVTGPCLVTAQAGNVNTGSVDPLEAIADVALPHGAWLHVDGAFGFWAVVSDSLRPLVAGLARAHSIATDAHKWLNVPYDCGIVFCADAAAHRRAMTRQAAYIVTTAAERDPRDFVPEESRRGRAVPVYAVLRALGRDGLSALVDRCCALARRAADRLSRDSRLEVLNDVVLNQVLVRAAGRGDQADALTRDIITRVQDDGTCWLGGTTWQGLAAIRISVSNWSTSDDDIDRSTDAILRAIEMGAPVRP
jgi:glutamate/tyrosine decarboxylase-like PLP-dependent enzyme